VGLSRGGFASLPSRITRFAMSGQRFPKSHRLKSPADFRRVFDRRRSATNGRITVCGCENDLGHARLGVSVSRKVGGAVARNRWKRMLREAFRLSRESLPTGVDLVIVAKDPTPPELAWLLAELPRLAGQVARKLK
jgi:ribonuclease P protein component